MNHLLAVTRRGVLQKAVAAGGGGSRSAVAAMSVRYHHPDPFNPKATKGWKAALKVRCYYRREGIMFFLSSPQ
jgi:hypothetical protein